MARKIFFSFHYERDAWRAGQVRNCNVVPNEDQYGIIDTAKWQSIESQGRKAIEHWINEQLKNTTTTGLLIGAETYTRNWVLYEILQSWNRGNGIVGIQIHNVKNQDSETDSLGPNPLNQFKVPDGTLLSAIFKTYDWVADDGRNNLGKWAEEAVKLRTKYPADCKITAIARESDTHHKFHFAATASTSAGFAPKAPWCPDYVDKRK